MNEILEKRKKYNWLEKRNAIAMDTEVLVTIAIQGHTHCPETEVCLSRSYSGDDACRCVRSVFATPEHYELYQCLRQIIFEAEMIHTVLGDKNANKQAK